MNTNLLNRTLREARETADHVTGLLLNDLVGKSVYRYPSIDEISFLFTDILMFEDYIGTAKQEGLWMGEAQERQERLWPKGSDEEIYGTDYQFVQVAERLRIEAMYVTDGLAPLHTKHAEKFDDGEGVCLVHASFKTIGPDAYQEAAKHLNDSSRLVIRREYQNGYGLFSYWAGVEGLFVKPRVNLRDS